MKAFQSTLVLASMVPLAIMVAAVASAAAETSSPAEPLPSLASVAWDGPGTTLEALHGKTVVVLSYVTWCPKCNVWSPDLLKQIKSASQDKPVVVLAICTEQPTLPGIEYMTQRDFLGPNIFHGSDESINTSLGLEKANLFNFAIIGPDGKVEDKGAAGSYFDAKDGKEFAIPRALKQSKNLGTFNFLSAKLSPAVKELLWPLELGRDVPEAMLIKARKQLNPSEQTEFDTAIDGYLGGQWKTVQELVKGDVPARLAAYDKCLGMSANFKTREQGKAAAKLATEMTKDAKFKKEVAAQAQYEKAMAQIEANPGRRDALLKGFAARFEGTHYGQVAAQQVGK